MFKSRCLKIKEPLAILCTQHWNNERSEASLMKTMPACKYVKPFTDCACTANFTQLVLRYDYTSVFCVFQVVFEGLQCSSVVIHFLSERQYVIFVCFQAISDLSLESVNGHGVRHIWEHIFYSQFLRFSNEACNLLNVSTGCLILHN